MPDEPFGPVDVRRLADWLADHPGAWIDADDDDDPGTETIDAIVDRILAEGIERPGQRRRRIVVLSSVAAVALIAGGATVAAVVRSGQPTRPEAGIVCRYSADGDGTATDAYVTASGADPIAMCRALWRDGRLGPLPVPTLVACIGSGGAVEVYPGEGDVCGSLGLPPADPSLSTENDKVVELHTSIERLNGGPCVDGRAGQQQLEDEFARLSLDGWTVHAIEDPAAITCAQAAVDPAAEHTVLLFDKA